MEKRDLPAPSLIQAWRSPLGPSGGVALFVILALCATACLGPLLLQLDPYALSNTRLVAPDWNMGPGGWLGTDDLGRDLLARLLFGARTSLCIAGTVVAASLVIGSFLGLVAAVYGGWIDMVVMRLIDILMILPSILLVIVVMAVLGPGLANALLAVTVIAMPRFTRLMRSAAVAEMQKLYVQVARTCGASRWQILWREVLPNCLATAMVQAALGVSDAVLDVAVLGFLGLGVPAPEAEWGTMLAEARPFIETAPYLVLLPGLCILATVLSFNLLGDALQDMFDPKAPAS